MNNYEDRNEQDPLEKRQIKNLDLENIRQRERIKNESRNETRSRFRGRTVLFSLNVAGP